MSDESRASRIFDALQFLSPPEGRFVKDLPESIGWEAWTSLDDQEWVEVNLVRRHREADDPRKYFTNLEFQPSNGRWFSPGIKPHIAGEMRVFLQDPSVHNESALIYKAKGRCVEDGNEIRLTPLGRVELETQLAVRAEADRERAESGLVSDGVNAGDADMEALANAYRPCNEIADHYGVSRDQLRTRLKRWRIAHYDETGYQENTNKAKNQPIFTYQASAVMDEIRALKPIGSVFVKRPSEKT